MLGSVFSDDDLDGIVDKGLEVIVVPRWSWTDNNRGVRALCMHGYAAFPGFGIRLRGLVFSRDSDCSGLPISAGPLLQTTIDRHWLLSSGMMASAAALIVGY